MVADPQYYIASEEGFTSTILDQFLAAGYYRMQHLIFTTNAIPDRETFKNYPVFWLRTDLNKIKGTKVCDSLKNKCACFKVSIKSENLNTEIETLYNDYKNSLNFTLSPNCYETLHQPEVPLPYDSKIIEIRKDGELIAAGFFDCGKQSIAGILNIYNPNYKKYSLGKYLMLLKIDYAIENKMDYYYTGYFSTGIPKFDYKIFPESRAIEIYLPKENIWVPYNSISKEQLNEYAHRHFNL